MIVKRIVTNIAATDVSKAREFYVDILGLEIVMDLGWITTFASPDKVEPQLSVATEGGSGTAVPDISVGSMISMKRCGAFEPLAYQSNMDPRMKTGTCGASTCAIHLGGWSIFSLTCDRSSVWALSKHRVRRAECLLRG